MSFASQHPRNLRGFTLIEILIVLFIMSIVAGAALVSMNQNNGKQLESFTNEITQLLTLAEEQAILQPNVLGLLVQEDAFQFFSLQPGKDQRQVLWIPLEDTVLSRYAIPSNVQVSLQLVGNKQKNDAKDEEEEKDKKVHPQVIISTNGDLTPFVIYVGKKGEKPRYVITGEADGHITNKFLS